MASAQKSQPGSASWNAATMWVLQPLLIDVVHDVVAVPLMAAKVVALGGSVVANFLLYRYVVWREPQAPDTVTVGQQQPAGHAAAPEATRR